MDTSANPFLTEGLDDINRSILDEQVLHTSTPAALRTPPTTITVPVTVSTVSPGINSIATQPFAQPIIYVQPSQSALSDRIIKKFHGYMHEDSDKFLSEFESYLLLSGVNISTESDRTMAAFHLHLAGPALTWYNALPAKPTWTAVRQKFCEEYGVNVNDPRLIAEAAAFDNLRLKPHQAIEEFHSVVLDKGRKLRKSDHDLMNKFIGGLPERLAFFVRAGRVTSFRESLQSAKIGEAHGYREQPMAPGLQQPLDPKPPSVGSVQVPTSVQRQLDEINNRLDSLTVGHRMRTKPQGAQGDVRVRICFRCQGKDHVKSKCNWNGQGQKSPESKCQLCAQYGHMAPTCATLVPNKSTPEACQLCNGSDHSAKNCPSLNLQGLGPARVSQT